MADNPKRQKLDPSGVPFATRTRGGKKARRAEARAQDTEAGLRVPEESWSEEKRAAWARLQDVQQRRRQLLTLEKEARDAFKKASAEDFGESLPSAPRGSGSRDLEGELEEEVEVEVGFEGEGEEESEGFYSAASVGASGAYSEQALGKPKPTSGEKPVSGVTRGRSRTRSPKPTTSRPSGEAPEAEAQDPQQVSKYIVTVPKHGKKRKEGSPKATSPKQVPKKTPEQKKDTEQQPQTITKSSGEVVLAPRPKSRPKAATEAEGSGPKASQGKGEQGEVPRPKVTLKPATSRAPLRVPVLAAEVEEQELRPAKGSLGDPAASVPIKAAPAAPVPKPGKGKQSETPAAQSIRLVFDFHGVLDLDQAECLRRGRKVFDPQGQVHGHTAALLCDFLRQNPLAEVLILTYIGRNSTDKRNNVLDAIKKLARGFLGKQVPNKISIIICDAREHKAIITQPLSPAIAADDTYDIVSDYSRTTAVHRPIWFDSLFDPKTGPAVPRGITWCRSFRQVLEIASQVEPSPTPKAWRALTPVLQGGLSSLPAGFSGGKARKGR